MKEISKALEVKSFTDADRIDGIQGYLIERISNGEIISTIQQQIVDKAIYEFDDNVELTYQAIYSAWQMRGHYSSEIVEIKGHDVKDPNWFVHIKFTDKQRDISIEYARVVSKKRKGGENNKFALLSLISQVTGKCMRTLIPLEIKQQIINHFLEMKMKGELNKKRQEIIIFYSTNTYKEYIDEYIEEIYDAKNIEEMTSEDCHEFILYKNSNQFDDDIILFITNKIVNNNKVIELTKLKDVSDNDINIVIKQIINNSINNLFTDNFETQITNSIIERLERIQK